MQELVLRIYACFLTKTTLEIFFSSCSSFRNNEETLRQNRSLERRVKKIGIVSQSKQHFLPQKASDSSPCHANIRSQIQQRRTKSEPQLSGKSKKKNQEGHVCCTTIALLTKAKLQIFLCVSFFYDFFDLFLHVVFASRKSEGYGIGNRRLEARKQGEGVRLK